MCWKSKRAFLLLGAVRRRTAVQAKHNYASIAPLPPFFTFTIYLYFLPHNVERMSVYLYRLLVLRKVEGVKMIPA